MFFFLSQTLDHRNTLHCCETLYFKRVPELKQKIKKNRPNKTTKKLTLNRQHSTDFPPKKKGNKTRQNRPNKPKKTNKKLRNNKNCWKGEINVFELRLKLDFVSLERMRE